MLAMLRHPSLREGILLAHLHSQTAPSQEDTGQLHKQDLQLCAKALLEVSAVDLPPCAQALVDLRLCTQALFKLCPPSLTLALSRSCRSRGPNHSPNLSRRCVHPAPRCCHHGGLGRQQALRAQATTRRHRGQWHTGGTCTAASMTRSQSAAKNAIVHCLPVKLLSTWALGGHCWGPRLKAPATLLLLLLLWRRTGQCRRSLSRPPFPGRQRRSNRLAIAR